MGTIFQKTGTFPILDKAKGVSGFFFFFLPKACKIQKTFDNKPAMNILQNIPRFFQDFCDILG